MLRGQQTSSYQVVPIENIAEAAARTMSCTFAEILTLRQGEVKTLQIPFVL